ncbi:cytochrome c oxidase subunit II [Crossiella sp. SN42]|uniref:aa3-type cytochrome oxidase subunit II n=1 Tax=Crossiella sp. SN42 TaxID=2944808 RepID=UPI00207D67D1|nr:cytochrome c oxidase subunit II [Crossiella sp. SN42]MCO1582569.1 cytochrome c oxidase subunit II [Crossiella sp. SN42]
MGRKEGNRAARLAKVTGLVSLVGVAASGCSAEEVLRFGWPKGVTPQAEAMRQLWTWSVIAALVVGVIVWALIFWSIIFHRKKSEEFPRQFQYNGPLEFVLIGLPMIIIVVLFVFATHAQNVVTNKDKTPDVNVKVWAFQWNWEFEYPEFKTPDGQTVRTTGSSTEIPLLVLPATKEVRYTIESKDVIHSFFVPEYNFKRDTIPFPQKNSQDNVFQNSIDHEGAFVGRCAELCGTYHAVMNFEVRALQPQVFDRYMQLRTKLNPATGKPYTAAEALTELKCGEWCAPQAIRTKPFDTSRTSRKPSGGDR